MWLVGLAARGEGANAHRREGPWETLPRHEVDVGQQESWPDQYEAEMKHHSDQPRLDVGRAQNLTKEIDDSAGRQNQCYRNHHDGDRGGEHRCRTIIVVPATAFRTGMRMH